MFRHGKPGVMELMIFSSMWLLGSSFRRRVRAILHPKLPAEDRAAA
jgi:hypothetical protein